ncbi:MAG: protein FdrA, partial [Pseudonocardiaceae bacterium]
MTFSVKIFPDTYVDSVAQLGAMRAMREIEGVDWASAAMGTPANMQTLRERGVDPAEIADTGSNDFVVVVRAASEDLAQDALAAGESAVFTARPPDDERTRSQPKSLRQAVETQPESNVAVISVPGEYAAMAAYQALTQGLHVLLFSDNVRLEKEIELK